MNFAVMDFVAAGRGEFRVCGQSAAYVRPDYVPAGLLRWENAKKRIFCGQKAAAGVRRRITPADGCPIIGQELINFQSDLRIVGQKRQEGPMKKVSPRSPVKIILTEVNMWVNMQP